MILSDEQGSVAIVTAVSLFALVAVLAFTVNSGHLYVEKNRYQNAAEEAAMAGALELCGDPVETALRVLRQTLFGGEWPEGEAPEEWAEVGHYDKDSGEFRHVDELGEDEFENAVRVTLSVKEQSLVPIFGGEGDMTVTASAIAFKEPYGLLAGGEPDDDPDIETRERFPAGYPVFQDMGRMHANGDMRFTGSPDFAGDTVATASGEVVNLPSGIEGAETVRDVRPVDWSALRAKAETSGRVFRMSDFPKRDTGIPADQNYLEYDGNRCYAVKADGKGFALGLREGDHSGAVYYISAEGPLEHPVEEYSISITGISEEYGSQITGFVVASELPLTFDNPMVRHTLGGPGEQMAYIYCRQAIGGSVPTLANFLHEGVIYRTEKTFTARVPAFYSAKQATYRMRIIADRAILLYGQKSVQSAETTLDGRFGPPCGPGILYLAPWKP